MYATKKEISDVRCMIFDIRCWDTDQKSYI